MRVSKFIGPVLFIAILLLGACSAAFGEEAALSGSVSSAEEGAMEGVVVSAKSAAPLTVSVVTDAQGHYAFPASRLAPGHYALAIRAGGYDLEGHAAADVAAGQSAIADLKLRKTKNLPAQLNDAEWLASMPGPDRFKKFLLNCNECHSLHRIVASTHSADEFLQVFPRMMHYCPCSTPTHPQPRKVARGLPPESFLRPFAEWLASVNLSENPDFAYPLHTLPRVKGAGTRVIITEYGLANPATEPHDVIVDRDGIIWFSEFGQQFLGRLDPKTGAVREFPIPVLREGWSLGALDLEADRDGNLWLGLQFQAGFAKFDKATGKVTVWKIPDAEDGSQVGMISPAASHVDGKVWMKNVDPNTLYRLDLASLKFEPVDALKDPATGKEIGAYGMPVDSKNNLYLLDFSSGTIGRIDAKTTALTVYHTPIPNSRPRRGRVDAQDRLWFAEYAGNAIGMLDPASGAIKEWVVPTPWSSPYDVVVDKRGDAWTASMWSDRVDRLDPKSGEIVEFPLPTKETNIRRVFVDNRSDPPTFYAGSNHAAAIIKLEPLD